MMKNRKIRKQATNISRKDDFSGESDIWIKRQIDHYINQAKKERGMKTLNRDSLESQMSINNNDATNIQSAVSREEILLCFKPEY